MQSGTHFIHGELLNGQTDAKADQDSKHNQIQDVIQCVADLLQNFRQQIGQHGNAGGLAVVEAGADTNPHHPQEENTGGFFVPGGVDVQNTAENADDDNDE